MCSPEAALKIAGSVVQYRQQKANNKAIRRDQETTRRNADKGYLHDMVKIDQEAINADMEKTKAEIKTKAERDSKISESLNLGAGNNTKIVQSIGALYDEDWNEITSGYEKDNQMFSNQQTEAYANLQKTYNSLRPPTDPSMAGLLIDVGTSAYEGYEANKNKGEPKQ